MKVSIITAAYNSAATIRDTLKSVQQQTYNNIEHIIIDGASTDETLNIINEFSHVSKVISEKDAGIYDAMNKGIQNATGDIVGILNSDDFFASSYSIAKIMNTIQEEEVDSVYGDLVYVDGKEPDKIIRYWRSKKYDVNNFLKGWQPPHPTFYVKKAIYDQYGLYDLNYKIGADTEFLIRVLNKHRISVAYIPEILVNMRMGGASNENINSRWTLVKEYHRAYKKNEVPYRFYTIPYRLLSKIPQYFAK